MQNQGSSRREFMTRSGAAMGAVALTPGLVWPQEPSGKKKIRIGVAGGNFGCSFQWHEHPDCIVEAVTDLRRGRRIRMKRVYNCEKEYDSLEDMLAKDTKIDAVAVFTPVPDHARHCIAALKAGKHVICAVPAAYTLEECQQLRDTVRETGLTYMMAETSYWQQFTITARQFYKEGRFGEIFYTESEYHHPGLEQIYFEGKEKTWRYGLPPMHYPTHCTTHLVGVTGERLTEVISMGWGDNDQILKDNPYDNPFWNETAMFKTNTGKPFRVCVWWKCAAMGCERAQWYGSKMSFFAPEPNGLPPMMVYNSEQREKDSGGFIRQQSLKQPYEQKEWYKTDMLPAPLRHESGHEGSHCFITHEFIDSLIHERQPATNIYESLAITAPGIVAHQSSRKGGELLKIPSFDA